MKGKDDFMKNVDESEYSIEYPESDTPTLTKLRYTESFFHSLFL